MLLCPPYLKRGDEVIILSTARKISREDLATAIAIFEGWGLRVRTGKTIGLSDNQYAGTDQERLEDFQQAVNDPGIRAIICARGGYGTVRMVDDIDWIGLMTHPKWITGFSDMTYLHVHLNQALGIQTLHSSVPALFHQNTPQAIDSIRQHLFGEPVTVHVPTHPLNRSGSARGVMIGGNLSILYSITGTRSGFNTAGKILFIEDIDERLYHLDRMMINMKRSGKLHDLAGLVVGGMTAMTDNEVPFGKTAEEIIKEHVERYGYPVCFDFPAGHIADNNAIVLGRMTQMDVGAQVVVS